MQRLFPTCLLAGLLFCSLTLAAQAGSTPDTANAATTDSLHRPHYKVEAESRFPGGSAAWIRYLSENMQYPRKAVRRKVEGTVVVRFVVEKDGTVGSVEAVSGDPLLVDEAVRVVQGSPQWIPARGDGKPLKSYKKQPISFSLPK